MPRMPAFLTTLNTCKPDTGPSQSKNNVSRQDCISVVLEFRSNDLPKLCDVARNGANLKKKGHPFFHRNRHASRNF